MQLIVHDTGRSKTLNALLQNPKQRKLTRHPTRVKDGYPTIYIPERSRLSLILRNSSNIARNLFKNMQRVDFQLANF